MAWSQGAVDNWDQGAVQTSSAAAGGSGATGGAASGAVKRRNAAEAALWYRQMAKQRQADLAKQEEALKKFRR